MVTDRMAALDDSTVAAWMSGLEARHLAHLTRPELTRALRALSSCYVERRDRLARGAALDGEGKRAAFALFYAPMHFLTVARIVHTLDAHGLNLTSIVDLGCGTGASGSAWALACARPPALIGIDRHPWAVQEANWTYRQFGLRGRAQVGDVTALSDRAGKTSGILLAYTVNELAADKRQLLLDQTIARVRRGATVLIVEPIARKVAGWWAEWTRGLGAAGARVDEWRFPGDLPPLLSEIASGAGLHPRELTARTIFVPSTGARTEGREANGEGRPPAAIG
jgi:hypothetical protein